jgi:hypothetical protein
VVDDLWDPMIFCSIYVICCYESKPYLCDRLLCSYCYKLHHFQILNIFLICCIHISVLRFLLFAHAPLITIVYMSLFSASVNHYYSSSSSHLALAAV